MTSTLVLDGRSLAYDDSGDPDAPPLVLLHGLSDARTTWREMAGPLSAHHRVLAVDQRGHGESYPAPGAYRVEHYTQDAARFIEEVAGAPVALAGHSLGGLVAAHLGATRPELVTRMYLEDPPLYMGDAEVFATTIFAAFFPFARQTLGDMRARNATLEEYEDLARAVPAINGEGSLADTLGPERTRDQARTWQRFDPDAFTPAIDGSLFADFDTAAPIPVPIRLLRAERDLGAAFFEDHEKLFLAAHPHASVALVAGASHLIHDERPEWFGRDLASFLAATTLRSGT